VHDGAFTNLGKAIKATSIHIKGRCYRRGRIIGIQRPTDSQSKIDFKAIVNNIMDLRVGSFPMVMSRIKRVKSGIEYMVGILRGIQ